MAARLGDALLAELAAVFAPSPALVSLLTRAGFPARRLPPAYGVDAEEYWSLIDDRISAGVVPDGPGLIIGFALRQYPANPVFRAAAADVARRVLVVGAGPARLNQVRADREFRVIEAALKGSAVEVDYLPAASVIDLAVLAANPPSVLHLCCHGRDGDLIFEGRDGGTHAVAAADLAETLGIAAASSGIRLHGIVLAACDSETSARALLPHARTVIGHRGALDDQDAVTFAGNFYRALRDTGSLRAAAALAAQLTVIDVNGQPWLRDGLVVLPEEDG